MAFARTRENVRKVVNLLRQEKDVAMRSEDSNMHEALEKLGNSFDRLVDLNMYEMAQGCGRKSFEKMMDHSNREGFADCLGRIADSLADVATDDL